MKATTAWGVLGAARIAQQQIIPAIRRAGAGEVLAVSSASGKADGYAAEVGIARAYGSHEALLADPDIESVYIALPNALHAEWIRKAAAAGKHVLCEKPITMSPSELAAVDRAAADSGVVVAEGFMYRHHPQLAEVGRMLTSGVLGDLVAMEARLHFDLDRREGGRDIRLDPTLGGGSLLDVGCYPVDLFGLLTGAEPEEVHAVAAFEGGVDTRFAGVLRYGSVTATFDCSFDSPFRNTATIIGTGGALTLSDVFRADRHGGAATMVLDTGDDRQELTVQGDQYAAEVSTFAGWVRQGRRDQADWALTTATTATLARLAGAAGPAA